MFAFTHFIFDLDGTLLDTKEDLVAATNHVLSRFGLPAIPPQRVHGYVGHGARAEVIFCPTPTFGSRLSGSIGNQGEQLIGGPDQELRGTSLLAALETGLQTLFSEPPGHPTDCYPGSPSGFDVHL